MRDQQTMRDLISNQRLDRETSDPPISVGRRSRREEGVRIVSATTLTLLLSSSGRSVHIPPLMLSDPLSLSLLPIPSDGLPLARPDLARRPSETRGHFFREHTDYLTSLREDSLIPSHADRRQTTCQDYPIFARRPGGLAPVSDLMSARSERINHHSVRVTRPAENRGHETFRDHQYSLKRLHESWEKILLMRRLRVAGTKGIVPSLLHLDTMPSVWYHVSVALPHHRVKGEANEDVNEDHSGKRTG